MAGAREDTKLHRFTVGEYHRMVDAGILREDEQVELIYGVIREMSPKNRPHVIAANKIWHVLHDGLGGRAGVYKEDPLGLLELDSEPEPDIVVTADPDVESYGTARAVPLLVVEVSDTSLGYDMNLKAGLYASGGIPEYWVVDLRHRELVVFRDPEGGDYRTKTVWSPGSRIAPRSFPDLEIEVEALFPARTAPSQ